MADPPSSSTEAVHVPLDVSHVIPVLLCTCPAAALYCPTHTAAASASRTPTMADVLSLPDAERLAEQVLAEIDAALRYVSGNQARRMTDRARVESDLAGLRLAVLHDGQEPHPEVQLGRIRRLFSDGLRATAALYGTDL